MKPTIVDTPASAIRDALRALGAAVRIQAAIAYYRACDQQARHEAARVHAYLRQAPRRVAAGIGE